MYLVFTCMPGESYCRRLRSLLLCLCEVLPWWSLCTLYLHSCQASVTVGDSGLCCCVCVKSYPGGVYVPCVYLHARRELQ